MNRALRQVAKKIISSETDKQNYNKYLQMMQHEGWQIYREYLLYFRGFLAEDMFGKDFTGLDPIEKDVTQRAYAMASELVMFLLNPIAEARRLADIKQHNLNMEATKGKRPERK